LVVAVGLAVAALLFGRKGVEVASWLAGVASLVVAVAAVVLARSAQSVPSSDAGRRGPVTASGTGQGSGPVAAGGDISGIASTGDNATNIQQR
jgi:membrane protein implicated in regulation of membrane protease activity